MPERRRLAAALLAAAPARRVRRRRATPRRATTAPCSTEPYVVPATPLTDTDGDAVLAGGGHRQPAHPGVLRLHPLPRHLPGGHGQPRPALTRLDEADRDEVEVVFVTTDPARDDEQTLRSYLDRFDPAFDRADRRPRDDHRRRRVARRRRREGDKLPSGGYEVTHGTHVIGDRRRRPGPDPVDRGTRAAELAADIQAARCTPRPDPQP